MLVMGIAILVTAVALSIINHLAYSKTLLEGVAGLPEDDSHGISLGEVESLLRQALVNSVLIGCGVVGLGMLLGLLVVATWSSPLAKLSGVARRVAAGDLQQKAEIRGSTEVKSLAQSINLMGSAIGERIAELNEYQVHLLIALGCCHQC